MASVHATGGRNNFDFLRFFFASLVILSHSYPLASGSEDHEPLKLLTGGQLTFGSLAVNCFFVISGFLISLSWNARPSPLIFLEKRARRIYPGFVLATFIGAFVITPLFSVNGAYDINADFLLRYLANTARLLQTVPGTAFENNPGRNVINGSLWSISYEFWCYIGLLVCGVVGFYRRPRWLALGFVATIVISFLFVYLNLTPGGRWLGAIFGYPPFWARLLPYFVAGMLFYSLRARVPLNATGAAACVVIFLAAAFVPHGLTLCLPLLATYLIFWFAYLPIPKLHRFGIHGDYSYGIYLYAFPIQQMIMYAHGGPMNPYALFLVSWVLSVAAGAASWWLIERHFVSVVKKTTPPSSGATA